MSNVYSFYFDGVLVQAVQACHSGGALTILDAHTFPEDELGAFLENCKGKNLIICYNPSIFSQDMLSLPPAAADHYATLVRSEIRKTHPELTSFTSFFSIIGQTTIEARTYNKIAAFSYAAPPLAAFLDVFTRHGKMISHAYAAPYSIFRMGVSACRDDAGRTRLFIVPIPGEKLLLFGANTELAFMRKIISTGAALLSEDIKNINMTLDYGLQSLRMTTVESVLLTRQETPDEFATLLTVPMKYSFPPALDGVPDHLATAYIAPLAAVMHYFEAPRTGDILPWEYVSEKQIRSMLSWGSRLMVALALIATGCAIAEYINISDLKTGIVNIRSRLSAASDELATYKKFDREVKHLQQAITLIHSGKATAIASLSRLDSQEFSINGLSIQDQEGFMNVRIDGDINVSGFSNVQAVFEMIIERLSKLPGFTVLSSNLAITQKTFSIQARYVGAGQQAR